MSRIVPPARSPIAAPRTNPAFAPTVIETATPSEPSAFMVTKAQSPSVTSQSTVCSPGPEADADQKV